MAPPEFKHLFMELFWPFVLCGFGTGFFERMSCVFVHRCAKKLSKCGALVKMAENLFFLVVSDSFECNNRLKAKSY